MSRKSSDDSTPESAGATNRSESPHGDDEAATRALNAYAAWAVARRGGRSLLGKGTISGALSVLDRLRRNYDLTVSAHTAPGGTQIRTSGPDVKRILGEHGEIRRFASEGGRTNRGLKQEIEALLNALHGAQLESLEEEARGHILWELQERLVEEVRAFFNQQRIEFIFNPTKSTAQLIAEILQNAGPKRGPVAQHLVGAKLELRFPGFALANESYSTADLQTRRAGDFQIGDVAFHVTVNPVLDVYDKCRKNIAAGMRPYLLVAEEAEFAAKQQAKLTAEGQIAVESIESFVSQNLEELSMFDGTERAQQLSRLLQIYNRRVDEAEVDKSLMVELPQNLLGLSGE